MSYIPVGLLVVSLLAAQPDLNAVLAEIQALASQYQDGGQTDRDRAALVAFFAEHDGALLDNSQYLLAKAHVQQRLEDFEGYSATFAKVPDEALSNSADLSNRLRQRLATDPIAAIPLARRRAAFTDEPRRESFIENLHNSIAQSFSPLKQDALTTARLQFLAALNDGTEPFLTTATGALRMWADAQGTTDADRLRALGSQSFGDPAAFGPRYQLLLAHLMEQRSDLRAEGRALRGRVIAVVTAEVSQLLQTEPRRTRERYWLAYACAAEARGAREDGNGADERVALKRAAAFSPDADDRERATSFFYERAQLSGAQEYRSAYADLLERSGEWEDALALRTEMATLDSSALPQLKATFARARPGRPFEAYWVDALFTGRPAAPDFTLQTPTGERLPLASYRGRWVLLDFWGTWCQPCQVDMPKIDALAREYPTHVLTLAYRDDPKTVAGYMKHRGYSYRVVLASNDVATAFGVPYFPFKLLVAPDGRYRALSNDTWEADVRAYLANLEPQAKGK